MNPPLFVAAALILAPLLGCSQDAPSVGTAKADPSASHLPLDVVNARMAAYNGHDIDAFMATYGDGIEVFTYPDQSLGKGRAHMRSIFEPMLEEGVVQVEIHHQIAKDSFVVNHETVTTGDSATEYVSIYEVRDGLIQSVCFVRD